MIKTLQLENANKVLVIRLSSLGDILLTTPVLRSIKKHFPHLEIDFLLKEEFYNLIKENPNVSEIFIYKSDKEQMEELREKLISKNYDLIIDLQNNFRTSSLLKKFKTKKVRFKKRDVEKFLLVKFKWNLMKDEKQIPVRYAESIGSLINTDVTTFLDDKSPDLYSDREPDKLLAGKEKFIGICPGAKHFTKRWLKKHFLELCKLLNENGFKPVLFGGKLDKELCSEIKQKIPNAINLCNDNDILKTAADMKKCKAVVSNDSGLMHTATAVGVPVAAIFGSTVKEFGFTPYNIKNNVIENSGLYCRPCSHIGKAECPEDHFRCMKEIKPRDVYNSLLDLLKIK